MFVSDYLIHPVCRAAKLVFTKQLAKKRCIVSRTTYCLLVSMNDDYSLLARCLVAVEPFQCIASEVPGFHQ